VSNFTPTSQSTEHPFNGRFEEFYRRNYLAVSRYVARRLPFEDHDGVVASTFVVAWRKFDQVENPSLPWLYRIARYEVAHEYRRNRRDSRSITLRDQAVTDTYAFEDTADVSLAFNQLSEDDAELLRLVHWERLDRSEVAEILGCSVNTVNVRYHRALRRLSSTLHRNSSVSSDVGAPGELNKEQL